MPRRTHRTRKPTNSQQQNRLRIIGGQWRGRKLEFSDLPGLRPTTDRVRETLFNWLQQQVPGARVLDLFSGSGALGLEALSRGAEQLILVDSAATVTRQLQSHLQLLNAQDRTQVVNANALTWLQAQPARPSFDLIFLDPPYHQGLLQECCQLLEQQQLLKPGGWIYIEAEKELQPLPVPTNWRLHRSLNAGQGSCYLLQSET